MGAVLDTRTPAQKRRERQILAALGVAVAIGLVVAASGSNGDDSTDTHCATAAMNRYEYVPGGPTERMTSDFIRRCERGY